MVIRLILVFLTTTTSFTFRSTFRPSTRSSFLRATSPSDEAAELLARAAKAREEAASLEVKMGKTPIAATVTVASSSTPVIKKRWTTSSSLSVLSVNDAKVQATLLREKTDLFKSLSPHKLKDFSLNLKQLELRTKGVLTGDTLGVTESNEDVSLDDFKDATVLVVVVCSILAIALPIALPGNTGAGFMYVFALLPILWISVGSTAPGLLAAVIELVKGGKEGAKIKNEKDQTRVIAHEAAHFLVGYCAGLPIKEVVIDGAGGSSRVEFFLTESGDYERSIEFTEETRNRLAVAAMSGAVGECVSLGAARGIKNDLTLLDEIYRRSETFLSDNKQQDVTRWAAICAHEILVERSDEYEAVKGVLANANGGEREKETLIRKCIAAIEETYAGWQ
ncbi:hypothetical protein ScalyP_jg7458 [Parmales sp. scaly parma]|nr:hypothetical protein ScalyP_jg7458 [Parmales sp. scaly parma]